MADQPSPKEGQLMLRVAKAGSKGTAADVADGSNGPEILTFALNQRPRATRASVPKVRSGCITCKRRHVKCDETKPACTRCVKWQGYCDGYGIRSTLPKSNGSRPKNSSATKTASGVPANSTTVMNLGKEPSYDSKVFANGWEKIYFDLWIGLSDVIGGGCFRSNFWNRTIPQLSRDDPAVRYAAMAVGALASARAPNIIPKTCVSFWKAAARPHYSHALNYYGQAMRLVSQKKGNKEEAVRSAIVACALFVCFEILQQNWGAADKHINHGLTIVQHFLSKYDKPGLHSELDIEDEEGDAESPSTPEEEADERKEVLDFRERSPDPLFIEDEVLQVFQRLEYQSWTMSIPVKSRESDVYPFRIAGSRKLQNIPTKFEDVDEARRWWDLVQHWTLYFPRTVARELNIAKEQLAKIDPERAEMLDMPDLPITNKLRPKFLAILDRWHASFLPLYARIRGERTDEMTYYRAISLLQQFHVTWICVRAAYLSEYSTMYLMTPKFKEVVRLSQIILPMQKRLMKCSEPFALDSGPVMALFITATKCRDPEVRDQAIELLKQHPRRDGWWDARAAAACCECNRYIEDMNQMEGTLQEQWARMRKRSAVFSDTTPEIYVQFCAKNPNTQKWEMTNGVVNYGGSNYSYRTVDSPSKESPGAESPSTDSTRTDSPRTDISSTPELIQELR